MVAIGGSMVGGAKCHDAIGTWPCRAVNGCGATHELECAYVSVSLRVRDILGLGLGLGFGFGFGFGFGLGLLYTGLKRMSSSARTSR